MTPYLESRLRNCYPQGFCEFFAADEANFKPARNFRNGLTDLLAEHGFYCSGPHVWSGEERVVEFPLHRIGDPDHWYFSNNKNEKIAELIREQRPHVELQVKVSSVIPAFLLEVTETWFEPSTWGEHATGSYDDGLRNLWSNHTTFEPWHTLANELYALADEYELSVFTEEALSQTTWLQLFDFNEEDREDEPNDYASPEGIAWIRKNLPLYDCDLKTALFASYT